MKSESMTFIVLCTVKKNMFPYKIEFCLCCPNKKAKHSFSPTHFMFHFLWPIDQLYQHLSTMTTLNINTSQESRSRWSVKPAKPASIEFTFCVRREREPAFVLHTPDHLQELWFYLIYLVNPGIMITACQSLQCIDIDWSIPAVLGHGGLSLGRDAQLSSSPAISTLGRWG